MFEAVYNILVLVGYVGFAYLSYWSVDKAWKAYVDAYLRKSKGKGNGKFPVDSVDIPGASRHASARRS
jgi:hypothetical protein